MKARKRELLLAVARMDQMILLYMNEVYLATVDLLRRFLLRTCDLEWSYDLILYIR